MKKFLVVLLLPLNVFGAELAINKVSGLLQGDIKASKAQLNLSCNKNNLFNTVNQVSVDGTISTSGKDQIVSFPATKVNTSDAGKLISCAVTLSLRLENNSVVSTVVAGSLSGMHKDVIKTLLDNKVSLTHKINTKISTTALKKDSRSISGFSLKLTNFSLICGAKNVNAEQAYRVTLDDSSVEYQTLSVEEFINGRAVDSFTELVSLIAPEPQAATYKGSVASLKVGSSLNDASLYIEGEKATDLVCIRVM